ncbi:Gfo/Idh/MocA family oxidoreductase [Microlunatus elymi]|uniref:Gfo/Idh/MocA family oxidoreductase n=1 Tax=Microlunatus elymi TaxID=2596828 RepID=A0A516PW27_9ACTN|nr:Gfo/Idh/MocA family oxidoreductase [Microlunatus elymi]QDP95359.1 Gfo/Idh/MocA family oxidoreductase [Microlunatus elymi]
MKLGVIGLGEVAQVVHLPLLSALTELFEVHSACDVSPELVRTVGDRFAIPNRYASSSDLINAGGIDAVAVLSSDEYHAEAVIQAVKQGLHVLVEKPMCLSPREAEAIIDARDRSGCTVMVGYMRRFAPAFLEAKEMLASLGRVNFARVHDVIGRNQLIIDQTSYVVRPQDLPQSAIEERWAKGRALVLDAIGDVDPAVAGAYRLLCGLGSHDLSAMRELLGPARGVHAARQWRDGNFIAAMLEYDDFVVSYETGVDEQLRFDAHLEVFGEHASFRVQYDTPYVRHLPTTLEVEQTSGDAITRTVRRPHLKDPYTHEWEYFHHCVSAGEKPKTSPEDFVTDLQLFAELVRHLDK